MSPRPTAGMYDDVMRHDRWWHRAGWVALGIGAVSVCLAVVFSDPRSAGEIGHNLLVAISAPFNPAWARVRSTGPVRRAALLVLFVALPVLLAPAHVARPGRSARALTALGIFLWGLSGFLMLSLRYVD